MKHLTSLALLVALCSPAAAQELLEGHSGHGEAFNEGPRQAAYLIDAPASVKFPVTVAREDLQTLFNQGVAQLHGFWYFEAERSFRQVAAEDPDCAMAYWGMAMANVDNEERAAGFARVAWLKRGLVSERERMFIDAIANYHGVGTPEEPQPEPEDQAATPADRPGSGGPDESSPAPKTRAEKEAEAKAAEAKRKLSEQRAAQLVEDYEDILWAYPDDIEAKAFLVNRLWMNRYRGHPISSRHANEALLQQIFAAEPMHPAHHYRIHLWDSKETAEHVVEAAVKSGPSNPSCAHMWHMGGHIFARLGRHTDAAWQQEASARVDHERMIRDKILPDQIHNFAHNNEWLTRSMRHHGRVAEAVDLAKNMIELPRHPKWNTLDQRGCSASYGRQRLLETLQLYEQWDQLAALADTMYLEPSEEAVDGALRSYALGVAHAWRGDGPGFEREVAALEAMLAREKLARVDDLEAAEEAALAAEYDDEDVRLAMEDALEEHARTLDDLRDKLDALRALRAVLAGEELEQNLALLEELRYERTHLARQLLEAGLAADDDERIERAVELAREAAEDADGQLVPHATLAHVLFAAGETEEALEVFDGLRAWSARADLELPPFQRLAPLAAARGLGSDWRVPFELPADVGERGDLAQLGPLRWTPPWAEPWTAPDAFGGELSLDDYQGRPVIVIFFLGFGCVHCVEQLQAFAPAQPEFAKAGIDIVTIGTNSVSELHEAFGGDPDDTGYPFPVLADPSMELFKLYRSFDDFEDMPLHGTFLVDPDGRQRWQDISYEPFMDWEFLLEESQRLLGLPVVDPEGAPTPRTNAGVSTGGATKGSR